MDLAMNNYLFNYLHNLNIGLPSKPAASSILQVASRSWIFQIYKLQRNLKPKQGWKCKQSQYQSQQSVGLEFCLVYSLISASTLCILPWSLLLLSWHLHLSALRATRRAFGVPEHVTDIFGKVRAQSFLFLFISLKSNISL